MSLLSILWKDEWVGKEHLVGDHDKDNNDDDNNDSIDHNRDDNSDDNDD